MARGRLPKTVYIRETIDGKSKWVKVTGLKVVQERDGDFTLYISKDNYSEIEFLSPSTWIYEEI